MSDKIQIYFACGLLLIRKTGGGNIRFFNIYIFVGLDLFRIVMLCFFAWKFKLILDLQAGLQPFSACQQDRQSSRNLSYQEYLHGCGNMGSGKAPYR